MITAAFVVGCIFSYLAPGVFVGRRVYAALVRGYTGYGSMDSVNKFVYSVGAFFSMLFWPLTGVFMALTIKPPMNAEEKAKLQEKKIKEQERQIADLERSLGINAQDRIGLLERDLGISSQHYLDKFGNVRRKATQQTAPPTFDG